MRRSLRQATGSATADPAGIAASCRRWPSRRFATSRRAAGRYLADVVLGTSKAPIGSYVARSRVARSSEESYDPQRERELWDAVEWFILLR